MCRFIDVRARSLCAAARLPFGAPAFDRVERALAARVDVHTPHLPLLELERPEDVHLDVDPAPGASGDLVSVGQEGALAERLDRARVHVEVLPRLDPVGIPLQESLATMEVPAVQELVV